MKTKRPDSTGTARTEALLRALHRAHPTPRVELEFRTPWELLIATILSAQCTDARVNQVTRDLFRRYPGPAELARARPADVERMIRPTGFFRAKAKSIQSCSRALVERHEGTVPSTMEELTRLPGVGRKTANVVLGAAYDVVSGIVVDTHMSRVARRLELTAAKEPERIERDLMAQIPQREWIFFSIAMILHGRYICVARRPRCGDCALSADCPSRSREEPRRPPRSRPRRRRGRS